MRLGPHSATCGWSGVLIALMLALQACGGASAGSQEPYELAFLHADVDVETEARAVEVSLERGGCTVSRRHREAAVVALAFDCPREERTAVRLVTRRGTQAFFDAGRGRDADAVGLSADERDVFADVDGDGERELLVQRRARGGAHTCLTPVRIARDGTATTLDVDTRALGEGSCLEGVEDVDREGSPVLIAVVPLVSLARIDVPEVPVPVRLGPDGVVQVLRTASFFAALDDRLMAETARARDARDLNALSRAAVERAAARRFAGGSRADVVSTFDHAFDGVVLDDATATWMRDARAALGRDVPRL